MERVKNIAEAERIAWKAEKLWKDDQYLEAEKLYYEALAIYPVYLELSEFAERAMKIGDIKGANKM
ncbi:MAG: hypothetical protein IPP43_05340 [Chitinophagaceae bacterium]|nr:hypothetical protein [Chitinophagaceae bacterium]